MPNNERSSLALTHAPTGAVARATYLTSTSVGAQCSAVVARLTALQTESSLIVPNEKTAKSALEGLPDPTEWGGRAVVPWGHPRCGGMLSKDVKGMRIGRTRWCFQYDGQTFDTIREVFVEARLNKQVTTPWTMPNRARACGCIQRGMTRHIVAEGAINVDAQLELLRQVLKHVALMAPDIDIDLLAADLFGGMRAITEHFLWRLEVDGYVDHADEERQLSLMLTAEGASVLFMLEFTKPGTNEDLMSAETLGLIAEADQPKAPTIDSRREAQRVDVPRFLNARGDDFGGQQITQSVLSP